MSDESKIVMRASKTAEIISAIADLYNVSLRKATDIYFESETSRLIEEGVADLHCRSGKYLASLIWDECNE